MSEMHLTLRIKAGVPRVCGDEPELSMTAGDAQMCSPRGRGWYLHKLRAVRLRLASRAPAEVNRLNLLPRTLGLPDGTGPAAYHGLATTAIKVVSAMLILECNEDLLWRLLVLQGACGQEVNKCGKGNGGRRSGQGSYN
jgi:hypothetical protein